MVDRDPKELMILAKQGDNEAFGALYRLFYTPVFRYISLRVRSRREAEDIAQTVFMKVFNSLPRYESTTAQPLAYFFTVARNTIIDFWRKEGRVVYDDEIVIEKGETLNEQKSDGYQREIKELIWQGLQTLTEDQRTILVYRFINELETKEIAQITGKREEAIRQLQSRALKILRVYFKEHNQEL